MPSTALAPPAGKAPSAAANVWWIDLRPAPHALTRVLDDADAGRPSFAAVVGEPGMGKSRLTEELAGLASLRGAGVLVGRCSQDEGAPPLWPWASVLAGLGAGLPVESGTEDGGRLRFLEVKGRIAAHTGSDSSTAHQRQHATS